MAKKGRSKSRSNKSFSKFPLKLGVFNIGSIKLTKSEIKKAAQGKSITRSVLGAKVTLKPFKIKPKTLK